MTQEERINSYIDNELSMDQEQEFLISLAASDSLRRSFRSELVMKKVIHRDEMLTNPPREMRTAVFATLGLATAATAGASTAKAATTNVTEAVAGHGLLKTLFATKMNALLTAAGLTLSAVAGYGVHSITSTSETANSEAARSTVRQVVQPSSESAQPVYHVPTTQPERNATTVTAEQNVATTQTQHTALERPERHTRHAAKPVATAEPKHVEPTVPMQTTGGGEVDMAPPVIKQK